MTDLAVPLEMALDRTLTGYLRIAPAASVADADPVVVSFCDGIPVVAYDPEQNCGGDRVVESLSPTGPYRGTLYRTPKDELEELHDRPTFRVEPGRPATVADAPALADRIREQAPAERTSVNDEDSVSAFLGDPEQIASLKAEARAEATTQAEEWGLSDQTIDRESQ